MDGSGRLSRALLRAQSRGHTGAAREESDARLARTEIAKGRNQTKARVIGNDEVNSLIASATETWRDPIEAQAVLGSRESEVLALTNGDVDREAGVVHIRAQVERNGKPIRVRLKTERSERDIPLNLL